MADGDAPAAAQAAQQEEHEASPQAPPAAHSTQPPGAEFLLHALSASGEEGALVRVAGCDVQPCSGGADNFLGELWRARITLEDAAGARRTRSLVVKREPPDAERQLFLRAAGLFDVEAAVYAHALPALLRLLRAAYGETFRPFWPHFVYASLDRSELVMEDLCALDYTMADRRSGLGLEQSKAVIKHMALLHAASVAMHARSPEAVYPFLQSMFRDSTRLYLETYLQASLLQLATQLREWPEYERFADRVEALADKSWDLVSAAVARDDTGFNVLNHGDLWVNNVMFRRGGSVTGDPVAALELEVAFLDWQCSVWTSPALDLLYFLYTSPADEVRCEHGDALLQLYQGTLQQALQAMGVGERAPSLETLRADLRRRFSLALFPAVAELPNMLAPPELYYDIAQYMLEAPPRNRNYAGEPYGTIIRRLLLLFEDCGVL